MNDNDFRNESQRYFDEMMKLYAKSGNANSNAEGVQSGPSSALGNSIPVNNNSATQRINNAERMSDNNMPEPEINLNEVREMPQGQTVTEQQSSMMREIPQGQTGMETQNRLMRETMDRNGDDSQKSAVERLAENIFPKQKFLIWKTM